MPRFIVYGAGAVGGVIGARLHRQGHEVVLIARGPHREAIARDGLRVESPVGSEVHRIAVVGDPAQAAPREDDVVLLTVKSQDTVASVERLAAVAGRGLVVACVQNGVANENAALRLFARTYAVVVMMPATHLVPGVVIEHSAPLAGSLDVGRHPAGVDETAQQIAAAFRGAGFGSRALPDISRWKYAKLLRNMENSARALLGQAPSREVLRRSRAEAEAVLDAAGIDHVADAEFDAHHAAIVTVRGAPGTLGSSWQSLARGLTQIEGDYLNGEIVLLGRLHGVPTPVNAALAQMAADAARDGVAAGSYSEEQVLAGI